MIKKAIIERLKKSPGLLNISAMIYSFPSFFNRRGKRSNTITCKGAFLNNTRIWFNGGNNRVIISPENRLKNCLLNINGNNCKIEINEHCYLKNLEIWIEDDEGQISIGYRTTIESGHIAATEGKSISIGKDCMFSHRIEIRNGDSHVIFDKETNTRINAAQPIIIGNHVWLGADTKVLKGSIIEEGAIIGTGGIVSSKIDKNSIYAGIPAKKIKENIIWERERNNHI